MKTKKDKEMLDVMKIFKVRFVRASPEDFYDFDETVDMDLEEIYDDPMVEITNGNRRILIDFDHSEDTLKTATEYIKARLGLTPIGISSDDDYYYIIAK